MLSAKLLISIIRRVMPRWLMGSNQSGSLYVMWQKKRYRRSQGWNKFCGKPFILVFLWKIGNPPPNCRQMTQSSRESLAIKAPFINAFSYVTKIWVPGWACQVPHSMVQYYWQCNFEIFMCSLQRLPPNLQNKSKGCMQTFWRVTRWATLMVDLS